MFKAAIAFIAIIGVSCSAAILIKDNGAMHAPVPDRACIEGHTELATKWVPKALAPGAIGIGPLRMVKRRQFVCDRTADGRINDTNPQFSEMKP